nr:hypothetical protein [uncultured Campylobacter sp.]
MLERVRELHIKAETAKALLELADSESEKRHFSKLLEKYKQELLKFLDEPQQKPSRAEPQEPKRLSAILADNGTDLAEINGEQEQDSNPLFNQN